MIQWLNKTIDNPFEFLAPRKGLLPLIGMFLIVTNFVLQYLPTGGFWKVISYFTSGWWLSSSA